jgi:hypothetical protein
MFVATDPFTELFQKHASDPEFIKQLTEQLRQLSTHESFVELVERWRTEYQMHNDDSTIVIINNFESQAFEILHEDSLAELAKGKDSPSPQQEIVTQKEELSSNDDTSDTIAVENAQKAVSELLNEHYDGKKSITQIIKWLKKYLLNPLIKDFLKH